MPRINLLPWRDELRKQRQKNFGVAAVAAVAVGVGIMLLARANVNAMIDHQKDRNEYLVDQIGELDKKITAIEELEKTKERLIARMNIIEQLQGSRPEIVHLFVEVARALPEGVFISDIKQSGSQVTITGVAESSTRVSAFMRNIDASEWLTDPGLNVVETVSSGRSRNSEFTIFAKQTRPKSATDGQEEG